MSDTLKIVSKYKKIEEITDANLDKETSKKLSSGTKSYHQFIPKIQKRGGAIVSFDFGRIVKAIHKAMIASGEGSPKEAELLAHRVAGGGGRISQKNKKFFSTVERVKKTVGKKIIF